MTDILGSVVKIRGAVLVEQLRFEESRLGLPITTALKVTRRRWHQHPLRVKKGGGSKRMGCNGPQIYVKTAYTSRQDTRTPFCHIRFVFFFYPHGISHCPHFQGTYTEWGHSLARLSARAVDNQRGSNQKIGQPH